MHWRGLKLGKWSLLFLQEGRVLTLLFSHLGCENQEFRIPSSHGRSIHVVQGSLLIYQCHFLEFVFWNSIWFVFDLVLKTYRMVYCYCICGYSDFFPNLDICTGTVVSLQYRCRFSEINPKFDMLPPRLFLSSKGDFFLFSGSTNYYLIVFHL